MARSICFRESPSTWIKTNPGSSAVSLLTGKPHNQMAHSARLKRRRQVRKRFSTRSITTWSRAFARVAGEGFKDGAGFFRHERPLDFDALEQCGQRVLLRFL